MFALIPRVRPLVPRIISCMVSFAPFACCHTVARVRLLLLLERIAAAQLSHPLLYTYSYSQIMLASASPGSWHSHPTYILLDYYLARTGTPGPAAATATDFVVVPLSLSIHYFKRPVASCRDGPDRHAHTSKNPDCIARTNDDRRSNPTFAGQCSRTASGCGGIRNSRVLLEPAEITGVSRPLEFEGGRHSRLRTDLPRCVSASSLAQVGRARAACWTTRTGEPLAARFARVFRLFQAVVVRFKRDRRRSES